jgi:hypothetical protein
MKDKTSNDEADDDLISASVLSDSKIPTNDETSEDDQGSPVDETPHDLGSEVSASIEGYEEDHSTEEDDQPSFDDSDSDDPVHSETFETNESPPSQMDGYITRISWPGAGQFGHDESIILAGNPSILRSVKRYASGCIITLVGVVLCVHYLTGETNALLQNELPFGMTMSVTPQYFVGLILLTLSGIGVILWAQVLRLHTWYFVTNQRTWVRKGVLSKKDEGSLDHPKVNNVEEKNPFPLNRWDVGHLELSSAASDGNELSIRHIKNPSEWKSTIRNEIQLESQSRDRLED